MCGCVASVAARAPGVTQHNVVLMIAAPRSAGLPWPPAYPSPARQARCSAQLAVAPLPKLHYLTTGRTMGSLPSRSLYGAAVEVLDLIAEAVHAALLAHLAAASPDDPFRHDEEVHNAASVLTDTLPSTLGRSAGLP